MTTPEASAAAWRLCADLGHLATSVQDPLYRVQDGASPVEHAQAAHGARARLVALAAHLLDAAAACGRVEALAESEVRS
jgi:hypothetical protein